MNTRVLHVRVHIYARETSRVATTVGWPRITPAGDTSVYSFNVYLYDRGDHTWRLLINKGTCATAPLARLRDGTCAHWMRKRRRMQIRGRVWSEDREDWKKERERERLEKGEKCRMMIGRGWDFEMCIFVSTRGERCTGCGLGVARGVGRGVRSGLFMAVKVANNEDLNGDDSISRRRWSMSSVLGNVFHSYEAWYFGKEYCLVYSTSPLIIVPSFLWWKIMELREYVTVNGKNDLRWIENVLLTYYWHNICILINEVI